MNRRKFLGGTLTGGAILGAASGMTTPTAAQAQQSKYLMYTDDLIVERDVPGQPHAGKVLAAIQPHADDIPIFCAGTVAKLIREGYTGYLIRTTNEDVSGQGTVGEGVLGNERDNAEVAQVLGCKKAFNLGYRKHRLDDAAAIELRARLIFLFRFLKVDTVISYDPWGHYEENMDHYVTAGAVEAACWMAGNQKEYPEQLKAGIPKYRVRERYYFARGPQLVNRVVDISSVIDRKVESNLANITFGPAGNKGVQLREKLAAQGKKLPILGDDDHTANFQFVKQFQLEDEKKLGRQYGCDYAEAYHYIGPDVIGPGPSGEYMPTLDAYIENHAEPL